ncbi:MAG: hypothetical protein PVH62_07480 [Anaerolineae bacterium]
MKSRFLAGLYGLSEPRTVAFVVSLGLAVLTLIGVLLPGQTAGGLLADPIEGGGGSG